MLQAETIFTIVTSFWRWRNGRTFWVCLSICWGAGGSSRVQWRQTIFGLRFPSRDPRSKTEKKTRVSATSLRRSWSCKKVATIWRRLRQPCRMLITAWRPSTRSIRVLQLWSRRTTHWCFSRITRMWLMHCFRTTIFWTSSYPAIWTAPSTLPKGNRPSWTTY